VLGARSLVTASAVGNTADIRMLVEKQSKTPDDEVGNLIVGPWAKEGINKWNHF
jgi:hypothetical protein